MDRIDCAVIGAGVIGLAVVRALALRGSECLILERAPAFGTQTSSRNSEVIHAGLYYEPGSLKAASCVRGRDLLYAHCARYAVPHRRCGKLIVAAAPAQRAALQAIQQRALDNGVDDLQWLDAAQLRRIEPALRGDAALLSPSSGIVDAHALMLSLLGQAEDAGARLVLRTPLDAARVVDGGIELRLGDEAGSRLHARWLVNAGGLQASEIAACIEGLPAQAAPRTWLAKGSYFALAGAAPFARLVYPLPEPGGLGVHLTLDLAGRARFGPDVEWVDRIDYAVDPSRARAFAAAVAPWWPAVRAERLSPGYAGVRPKLGGPGEPPADFRIDGPAQHGVPGVVNLFGIESPGLTAALDLAQRVADIVACGHA